MFIYFVIGIAALYVASATINFKKVPKYKHAYFIPMYILFWFDLLFSIGASFNRPWMSTMVGFWTSLPAILINAVVLVYAFYKHKSLGLPFGTQAKPKSKPSVWQWASVWLYAIGATFMAWTREPNLKYVGIIIVVVGLLFFVFQQRSQRK